MNKSLHTLNTSPADQHTFNHCIEAMSTSDELLLIEDGVYFAMPIHRAKIPANINLYALHIDLEARGVKADNTVKVINDAEFVNLSLRCQRVVSWF